ncbi:regulatory protein RecX [Williamsia sp.]|uniref:regulatory protein RecX n=1 Tax=Williamsia sp. TaxID=1872085 RepID=UPI002F939DAF
MNVPEGEDIRASIAELRSATTEILSRPVSIDDPVPDVRGPEITSALVEEPAPASRSLSSSPGASAYDAALRLLGVRARSQAELRGRLQDKDFPPPEIDSVMERLDRAGLLDDADFAEQWVRSRHLHSGKGRTALRHELRQKGVVDTVIEQAVGQVDDNSERERAAELLRRKTSRLSAEDVSERESRDKHTRRLVAMLARRGYAPSLAFDLVKTQLNDLR